MARRHASHRRPAHSGEMQRIPTPLRWYASGKDRARFRRWTRIGNRRRHRRRHGLHQRHRRDPVVVRVRAALRPLRLEQRACSDVEGTGERVAGLHAGSAATLGSLDDGHTQSGRVTAQPMTGAGNARVPRASFAGRSLPGGRGITASRRPLTPGTCAVVPGPSHRPAASATGPSVPARRHPPERTGCLRGLGSRREERRFGPGPARAGRTESGCSAACLPAGRQGPGLAVGAVGADGFEPPTSAL